MFNLQLPQVLLTALLPFLSTLFAGAARQDKFGPATNEFISFLTPILAGFGNVFAYGGFMSVNSLLLFAGGVVWAGISHWKFLYRAQEDLQHVLLSFGVKPAQLQALEREITSPQVLAALENFAAQLGSHNAVVNSLLQEFRQIRPVLATLIPAQTVNQVPVEQIRPQSIVSVIPPNATATTVAFASPAQVPQQPFPASSLHWGDTGVMPVTK